MRLHDEYRDDICCCGATLNDSPTPYSWQDHGFCNMRHAIDSNLTLHLAGQSAQDAAILSARHGGPGFEGDIVREWKKAAQPNAPAILRRMDSAADMPDGAPRDSWAWRLFAGGQCVAVRFTSKLK